MQDPILDNQIIFNFQEKIRKRRETHRRDLPWRNTTDPYTIWISESMLCQTQVNRVIDYYHKRLAKFPTVHDLAHASNEEVLRLWSGLGYNSRALRLKQAAILIDKNGAFPTAYEQLITLPGVGDYIANAVLAFAYNKDVVVMDTNIRRIMMYEFGEKWRKIEEDGGKLGKIEKGSEKRIRSLILETLPKGRARDRYNALMDYGALELTARKSGIAPSIKQSKFAGSTRQVRAGIIRLILESPTGFVTHSAIEKLHNERDDVDQIISKMIQEKIIQKDNYGFRIG